MNTNNVTEVVFYLEGNEVFAYFPNDDFDRMGNKMCYAHIGQHSACSPSYIKGKRKAKPEQYEALKTELIGIGYNLLIK